MSFEKKKKINQPSPIEQVLFPGYFQAQFLLFFLLCIFNGFFEKIFLSSSGSFTLFQFPLLLHLPKSKTQKENVGHTLKVKEEHGIKIPQWP